MKKSIVGILLVFFTFNACAQKHEVFAKLNQLSGYSAQFENKLLNQNNNNKVINALNYAIGYNYFFKSKKYLGVSFGYIPRKSRFLTTQDQGAQRAVSDWRRNQTHYTFGLHAGRLFEIAKFKFYSEGGVGMRLFRNVQNVNDAKIYDKATNAVVSSSVETETIANAHEYQFRISQGVYYKIFKGFSVGVDLPMVFFWYKMNGPITTHRIGVNVTGTTETNASSEEKTTTYNFGISPSLGIRYTFK